MKKLLFLLFIGLTALTVSAQKPKAHADKPAKTAKTTKAAKSQKGNNGSVYVHSGTFKFYSDALKADVEVNCYGRYSSVVVDGTEYLGTTKKGHIVAKEDDNVIFDGYMYNGGKTLRGLFNGRQTTFTRKK